MRILSGRFRREYITKHFDKAYKNSGFCSLDLCQSPSTEHLGDVESFLLSCPSLSEARNKFNLFLDSFLLEHPYLTSLVHECFSSNSCQFLIDCSTLPNVISATQTFGEDVLMLLFKITRNYCFIMHSSRNQQLQSKNC